ncbi:MAG: Crp/Fnr family transcriptional regulator [Flavobacteriales bacterium]|nr:Crp/Fnr family transcriptional regulator [Flavobacteriales bacterium]
MCANTLSPTALFEYLKGNHPDKVGEILLNRDEALLKAGQRERFIYFVTKGALRVTHTTGSREQNIRFGYAGSIITSLPAFFSSAPSLFDIRAIRKTAVDSCPKALFFEEIAKSELLMASYTKILEELISQLVEREIDLLETTPQERYKKVSARSPELFQKVPAKHIANYLRMTPEHFSRLQKS